jgi:hypothetical protein
MESQEADPRWAVYRLEGVHEYTRCTPISNRPWLGRILLSGRWLPRCGFPIGCRVRVGFVGEGRIMIENADLYSDDTWKDFADENEEE